MKRPAPVVDMRSLTTLTPHLREPVVYPISLEAVAEQFSMPLSSCTVREGAWGRIEGGEMWALENAHALVS